MKSSTEVLRELLDERGVEYTTSDHAVPVTEWNGFTVAQLMTDSETLVASLTPQQAIAATLGERSKTEQNGVTAEQVRKAIEENSWVDLNWQAIADELNAMLGAGTCHVTVQDNMAETEGMGDVWLECDACHWQMPLEPSTPRFNFCPNCGRKVEG